MPRLHRFAAAPVLAGALLAGPVVTGADTAVLPSAVAHDALVSANPMDGEVLSTAPDRIELTFSTHPRETFNTVALSRDGEVLLTGTPDINGNILSVDIPADVDMADGEYTVAFRITSSDGHVTEGKYSFTMAADGTAPGAGQSPEASAGNPTEDDGLPGWAEPVLGIAGVIVLAGVLVMLIARRRAADN